MKLLELFSRTGSVAKVACDKGQSSFSLDLKDTDINSDILERNYTEDEDGDVDFTWASPPCTEYSIAKTTGIRKVDEANKIVLKAIEIMEYLKPK